MKARIAYATPARASRGRVRRMRRTRLGMRDRTAFLLIVAAVCLAAELTPDTAAAAGPFHVTANGQDTISCGSVAAPCLTIQFAVNQIAMNGTGTVLVAGSPAGVHYTYDAASDVCSSPLGTTGVVCVVNKQVVIIGGFSASDWSVSRPDTNRTVIDGKGIHRGVLAISTGPSASLDLEGCVVENGFATGIPARSGDESFFGSGGGLLAEFLTSLTIRQVVFRENEAVGNDVATEYGGAGAGGGAAVKWVSASTLADVVFEGNEARGGTGVARGGYGQGGGLFTFQSTLTGHRLTFRRNLAVAGSSSGNGLSSSDNGGRADGQGGAANFEQGSTVELSAVSARNNSAIGGNAQHDAGGGFGGAIHAEEATLAVADADLSQNLAQGGNAINGWLGNGGALAAIHSRVTLDRTTIIGNLAQGGNGTTGGRGPAGGGGINSTWVTTGKTSTLDVINSVIAENMVVPGAGTVVTGGGGGGLWIQATTATLVHSTVARNQVDASMNGQAILVIESPVGAASPTPGSAEIDYTIIADHSGFQSWQMAALHVRPGNSATLNRGLLAGNSRDSNAGGAPAPAGTISGLSTMVSAASPGFASPGPPLSDYHLTATSPARDQALSSTTALDIDGESRSAHVPRDIGADEYTTPGSIAGALKDSAAAAAAGVTVEAYRALTLALASSTVTSGDGSFVLSGLAPGDYILRDADAAASKRFLVQWYPHEPAERLALSITATSAATTSGIDDTLDAAPSCRGLRPTIVGSNGDDYLLGTPGPDVIVSAAGDDEIYGLGGDDAICAGSGNDLIDGGGGNDYLNGGAGDDVLRGKGGNDTLVDMGGHNTHIGGTGNDTCRGNTGDVRRTCELP